MKDWDTIYQEMKRPFPEKEIRWRAGATTRDKTKAQALPYAEPRVYEDRLNQVIGHDWECRFITWDSHKIICELTILGKTRSSSGESEENNPSIVGTTAEAQAFKRACSKFGLGRYLYDFPSPWVPYDKERRQLKEAPPHPKLQQPTPKKVNPQKSLTIDEANRLSDSLSALRPNATSTELIEDASMVVGRRVTSFTELTRSEAKEVHRLLTKIEEAITKRQKPQSSTHTAESKPKQDYTDSSLTSQEAMELGKELTKLGLDREARLNLASAVFAREITGLMQLKNFEVPALIEAAEQINKGEARIDSGALVLVD